MNNDMEIWIIFYAEKNNIKSPASGSRDATFDAPGGSRPQGPAVATRATTP